MVRKSKRPRQRVAGWQTAEAKANFSGVIAAAAIEPQVIRRHARPVAVVLSHDAYTRLAGAEISKPAPTVAETLAELRPLLANETEELVLPPRSSRPLPAGFANDP